MSYPESDLIPLSALQHLLFCERQCALIHLERVWVENRYTAEGNVLHRKAHEGKPTTRDGVRVSRGLPIRSLQLGLVGQTDVVLWKPPDDLSTSAANRTLAQALRAADSQSLSRWTVTPVEYKRGSPKKNDCDRVQLCAQALCLEEMLDIAIPLGQLFYGKQRRRVDVAIDQSLRDLTCQSALRLHELFAAGVTPRAAREKKCDTCSLLPVCLPDAMGPRRSAQRFFDKQFAEVLADEDSP
jgi:CRISPR-associated exonuclease Cas4